MREERSRPAGAGSGWLSNRRSLIKTATGLAAAGVVGSALADSSSTASATEVGGGPVSGGRVTRDVLASSPEFFVTITGARQGKFKGDNSTSKTGGELKINGFGFHYEVNSPRDAVSGQASGKRQHQPVIFTKEWGASTPQLMQALVTNEDLTNVTFSFMSLNNAHGQATVDFTIKLQNASVASIEQYVDYFSAGHPTSEDLRRLEDISFTFQKIEWTFTDGGITASDDWSTPR
ncbi:MAG: type VI secretion system tube protein TssD [Dehalococcoidia bacterium]